MGDDTSPATLPPSVSLKQIEGLVLKELRSLGTLNDARRVRVNVRSKLMSGNPNRLRSRDGSTGASGDAVNAAEHALSAKEADLHSRAEQLRKATEREETRLTALERAAHSKLDHLKTQVLSTLARQADRFVLLRAFAKWQAYRARSAETRREKTLGQEGERARQRNAEQLALLQAQREMGETERRRLEEKVKEQDAAREEFRLRYEKRRGMEGQLEQQQQWELLGQRRQQILQQEVDGECNKQAANGTAANGSRRDSTEISQQNPGRKRSSTGKHQRLVLDLLQNMCDKICGVNSPMHPQKIFINISPDVANEVRRTRSASASQRSVVVPGWRADVSESQETSLERESPDECISVSPALHVSLHSPLPTTPDNPRTMRTDTSRFGIGKDRITHASAYEGPATGLKTFILEALHCFSRRWRVSLEDASVCFLVEEPCASQRFNAQAEVFMEATLGTMRAGSLCVISVVELVLRSRGMRDPVLVVSQHPDGSDLVVTAFKNFAPQSRAFAFGNARSTRSRCEQFVGSAAITSCLLELSPDDAAIALRRVVLLHLPHESAAVLDVDPGAHVVSFPTVNAVLSEAMVFLLDRPLDVTWMAALERVQLPYRHH
ncbi:hypothetical protein DIPPA_03364 [Diplonema papillatum]|nr:hypothetical protein DIPPA_03364 [Diplonema papillatum]